MMNIWNMNNWKRFYSQSSRKEGLRVLYDSKLNCEVRRSIKDFVEWLRAEYIFPKRVRMYVKSSRRIKAKNGDLVCGTFFRPYNRDVEPYIRIATGDYPELLVKYGIDDALFKILWSIAHELTHYFQWLNDLELTLIGEERQATNHANKIMLEYSQTRDHP